MYGYYDRCARALVGCAMGHVVVGTEADIRQARQAISRAMRFYRAAGLSSDQAAAQIASYAQLLGGLE